MRPAALQYPRGGGNLPLFQQAQILPEFFSESFKLELDTSPRSQISGITQEIKDRAGFSSDLRETLPEDISVYISQYLLVQSILRVLSEHHNVLYPAQGAVAGGE